MKITTLPKQPPLFWSYLVVGRLLYLSMWLFVLESLLFWRALKHAYLNGHHFLLLAFWVICFGFSFVHIFLVMADGWSRFQNYKRIKDQLFLYGFKPRLAQMYMGSKCQRMAVETAAAELGIGPEVRRYYYDQGYRWFHFVPDFMIRDPFFFFRGYFWNRTFLEKHYEPQFDFHRLECELARS